MINRSDEDWLTISGLPRLTSTGRNWQGDARKQVRAALLQVVKAFQLQLRFEVLYVFNPIKKRLTGPTLYQVRLSSVEASKAIRDAFSGFFRRNSPVPKPPGLRDVTSIRNRVTMATRVRVEIMRQLAANYHKNNPGSSYDVRGYVSRPSVVIVPPPSAKDPRAKTYFFMEAVSTLPATLSDENLIAIFKVIGMSFPGQLSSLFVILCDDDRDRAFQLVKDQRNQPRGRSGHADASTFSGITTGLGSGVELDADFLKSVRQPPPPPPPLSPSTMVSPITEAPHKDSDRSRRVRMRSPVRSPSPSRRRSRSSTPSRRRSRSPAASRKRKRKSGRSNKHKSRKSRRDSSSSSSSGSTSASRSSDSDRDRSPAKKGGRK